MSDGPDYALLLARQRSGTGPLGALLGCHSRIHFFGEVFHPDNLEQRENYFRFLLETIARDPRRALPAASEANYREFLQRLSQLCDKEQYILDVKYPSTHHLNGAWQVVTDPPTMLQYAFRDGAKIIHLKRKNHLKTFVSGRLAELNRVWHATAESKFSHRTVALSTWSVMNFLNSAQREDGFFDQVLSGYHNKIDVEYEEFLRPDGTASAQQVDRLLQHFHVPHEDGLAPHWIKQTSNELREVIENYDEVSSALSGTPYAWMLH